MKYDKDFHKQAMDRFSAAWEADQENRKKAESDLGFLTGEGQWEETDRQARDTAGQPTLTINRMPQFVRQVTGDIRAANPAIKITPGDAQATKQMADVFAGITRAIEYDCDGSSIYERAAQSAAQCGIGNWRILTEYEHEETFDQVIKMQSIPNPFAVYWDPAAKDPSRLDAEWAFVTDWVKKDDFEKKYPKASAVDVDAHDDGGYWLNSEDRIRVAEYWWREATKGKLYLLPGGVVSHDLPDGVEPEMERETIKYVVKHCKISGAEVIEKPQEWAGKYLPIVATTGEEVHNGEQVIRSSVIRYAKDSQRMFNYWNSAHTELVAMQPRAPYLATPEQIMGHETMWAESNRKNRPYLVYNNDPRAPGAPRREAPPVASSAILQSIQMAAEDMKATTGIFDAGLGAQSNETSGVAIRQRQIEGDIANSIYIDNLAKSIAYCGRIIVDLIPKIYDANRMVRIIGEDDAEDLIELNIMVAEDDPQSGMRVYRMANDPSFGRYSVRCSTGPNYTTKRQETSEQMLAMVQAVPAIGQVAGDLIAKSQDWPGAEQLAERLKKMLPPGIADGGDEQDGAQAQAAQQQQAMAMQQQAMAAEAEQAAMTASVQKQVSEAREAEAQAVEAEAKAKLAQLNLERAAIELAAQQSGGFVPPYQG